MELPMTDTHAADLTFLTHLGKHLGVLGVEYVLVDKDGRDKGKPQMQTCSGFFIVLDNQWYFVTAGHVLERADGPLGIKQALDAKAIRITRAFLADYFGPDAKPHPFGSDEVWLPTVIDLHDPLAQAVFINDDTTGLDFAFLPLRDFYVASVTKNGVVPLTEDQWEYHGEAMKYVLVGFPDEEKSPSATDSSPEASVRPCFARMDRCELPSHLPKPTLPYFAAKLPDEGPVSPAGFSGSPIFAVDVDVGANRTYYALIGIDYKWHKSERIVVGCLMRDVVAEFRKRLAARGVGSRQP
jgi:hypothetical protein